MIRDCKAQYLVYLDLACTTKQARLVSNFAQETLQVRPKFLKTECQLLGTYIISLTVFGDPRMVVLGFLFSLLFITMGAVFHRRSVLTLILEQEKVSGNYIVQLKIIKLLPRLQIEGYIPV